MVWKLQGIPACFSRIMQNVTERVTPPIVDRMNKHEYASIPDIPVLIASMVPVRTSLQPKARMLAPMKLGTQTGKG